MQADVLWAGSRSGPTLCCHARQSKCSSSEGRPSFSGASLPAHQGKGMSVGEGGSISGWRTRQGGRG